jgi:hypothetical protein
MRHLFDGIYENAIYENAIYENASTRHGVPASRLVKSSPSAFYFLFYPPPYRRKPRYTRGAEASRLSVNYLTLL